MATNFSPDAAAEAAQRLLNDRVDAVRTLAKARQQRIDARAHIDDAERADAERADATAYAAAQRAGWSTDELRKVGFDEPRPQDAWTPTPPPFPAQWVDRSRRTRRRPAVTRLRPAHIAAHCRAGPGPGPPAGASPPPGRPEDATPAGRPLRSAEGTP
jgi:hypothetical protein